jgi:hypothetical protein
VVLKVRAQFTALVRKKAGLAPWPIEVIRTEFSNIRQHRLGNEAFTNLLWAISESSRS